LHSLIQLVLLLKSFNEKSFQSYEYEYEYEYEYGNWPVIELCMQTILTLLPFTSHFFLAQLFSMTVCFIKTHANKHNKNTSSLLEFLVQTSHWHKLSSVQLTTFTTWPSSQYIEHTQREPVAGTSQTGAVAAVAGAAAAVAQTFLG